MVNNPNKQTDDVDSSFSCIINLFKSVGISEKGIEKVYHFLLQHQDFVDPKLIQTELDFTLKRIYKIINELKKYDLIQVYGRPMEIKINNPRKSWEKILNNKIDEINEKSEQKILECEKSLNTFFSNFKSDSTPMELMPVEYISLISKD